jgi:hypothetical protein
VMRHPTISVRTTGSLYFAVSTPCGESWAGMTNSDDLAIQVRKALGHADACGMCAEIDAALRGGENR